MNTLQTPSRLLSFPTPSHSTPQKQPACAHNYFYLLPKPQTTFCEAFNTYSRGEEVSLVLPSKPPDVHSTAYADCKPAHCVRREAGSHSSKNLPVTPPHAIWPLVGEPAESLSHANTLVWSWHEPAGDHLAAAGAEHDGASLAGYPHTLPAQQFIEKDLSACQASVTQPLHCMQPKIFCYVWTPAGNLPTQRRGPQVGAMHLSLTGDVPPCSLVKPTLK